MFNEIALKLLDVGVSIGVLAIGLFVVYKYFSNQIVLKEQHIKEKDQQIKDITESRIEEIKKTIELVKEVNDRYDKYVINISNEISGKMENKFTAFTSELKEALTDRLSTLQNIIEKNSK